MTDVFKNLQKKLQEALTEREQLRQENAQLKTVFKESPSPSVIKPNIKVHQPASALSPINHQSPVEEKIWVFVIVAERNTSWPYILPTKTNRYLQNDSEGIVG